MEIESHQTEPEKGKSQQKMLPCTGECYIYQSIKLFLSLISRSVGPIVKEPSWTTLTIE